MDSRRRPNSGGANPPSALRRACRTAAIAVAAALAFAATAARAADPLASYEFRVVGAELRVAPAVLSVPKGIPGSLAVDVVAADGSRNAATAALAEGAVVEATLRGPSFPARRLVGAPDRPLLLPPLPLVGEYRLDDVRLVDRATGATRLAGTPNGVPIRVFEEVLVSRVTSRPLSYEEIEERGIAIDESSFQVLEFEVGFVVDGATVPVRFPVVSPRLVQSTEIVPNAELEELLARADAINRTLAETVALPPELEAANLGFEAKPINFQFVAPGGGQDLELQVPPIPALLLIPGRIGLLNQFFSVQLFTQNAAPGGSGLSVHTIDARLVLPRGYDGLEGTPDAPGDDPLRFARLGPDRVVEPVQRVATPGRDGTPGTTDDGERLFPGDTGQAEFLVEGLDEGLHVLDVELTGVLEGFAAGPVSIRGRAAGSVLVRNPSFSLAFSHPRTIRSGEPYTASVTVLNTSPAPANLVSVTLPGSALSGATFEPGSSDRVELGTVAPGETATAEWRLRAQRTGAITFSQLISDEDITGRFRLRMGVDERGVALSPDAIGYPEYVDDVEAAAPDVFAAANRVLGQALSVASAAVVPPNVLPIARSTLERRVVELAEAGQRLRYGDLPGRIWADLLLDWQGARGASLGFDQLLRTTGAGREWREAIAAAQEAAEAGDTAARLVARAEDLAGRGEAWQIAATSDPHVVPSFDAGGASATLDASAVADALGYRGALGHALVLRSAAGGVARFDVGASAAAFEIAWLDLAGDGGGRLLEWSIPGAAAGDCLRFAAMPGATALDFDAGCDGASESRLEAAVRPVLERPPEVIAALQDLDVRVGRPPSPCFRSEPRNYGTVLAVLYSKPLTQASAGAPGAYVLDDGNAGTSVQIQPGGRVALVNLARPIGRIRPEPPATRVLTVSGVEDPRGNAVAPEPIAIEALASEGVALRGVVAGVDGAPAAGVPVTLTMYDENDGIDGCTGWVRRISQVASDADGRFAFDFVLAGIPFAVSATDTRGLSADAIRILRDATVGDAIDRGRLEDAADANPGTLLAAFAAGGMSQAIARAEGVDRAVFRDLVPEGSVREGSETPVALRFRGRAAVEGTVYEPDGATPVAGAAVNLFPDPDSRERGRGVFTDDRGRFAFAGVPLGGFTIAAQSPSGLARSVSGSLATTGATQQVDVVLAAEFVPRTTLRGRVLEADRATPHPGARVLVGEGDGESLTGVVASVVADARGVFEARDVPVGSWTVAALSADGRRGGRTTNVPLVEGADAFTDVLLADRSDLTVQVLFANGDPVAGALVSGGERLATTDALGRATLTGVPTGRRTLAAGYRGDESHPDPRRRTTRTATQQVDVVAGLDAMVVFTMPERGSIFGQVRDANGAPVPDVKVAVPIGQQGFFYAEADSAGRFRFPDLGLGEYTVSAPAPPISERSVDAILEALGGEPEEEELLAAIGEAFAIFTGIDDPLLNPVPFNPLAWGYTRVRLDADGTAQPADVRYLVPGSVRGTTVNGQGVPIGARVRLTGVGPSSVGDVTTVIRGERNSDPATGVFEFVGQALEGSFGLQAASPFFPSVISADGQITAIEPEPPPVVMQFPAVREVNGRITGTVLDADGVPVAGAQVRIHFDSTCPDFPAAPSGGCVTRIADANGRFGEESQLFDLPAIQLGRARSYRVEAFDALGSQRVATALATLSPATTTDVTLRLLAEGGASIQVLQAGGAPAPGAEVAIRGLAYPNRALEGVADESGHLAFGDAGTGAFPLPEGPYTVEARFLAGATAVRGRRSVTVERGAIAAASVVLGPTASLHGRFVDLDGTTPVAFAPVRVGDIAFATTDADGAFAVGGVPLGTHVVTGQDAVTGRYAQATVVLASADEDREVLLRVRASGELVGAVVSSDGGRFVPAAKVTLRSLDGVSPAREATTDPAGFFSFPGTPAGRFQLEALDPVTRVGGSVEGTFPDGATRLRTDVLLEPRASFTVRVFEPDGVTPALARVEAGTGVTIGLDTDLEGRAHFAQMRVQRWPLRATSRAPGATRSTGAAELIVTRAGPVAGEVAIVLGGVGSVAGRVFESDGVTPAASADVEIFFEGPFHAGQSAFADGIEAGAFTISNVPVGAFRLAARQGALGATARGVLALDGASESIDLVLGESGSVFGRVVDPSGAPAAGAQVTLRYQPQSAAADETLAITGADGAFRFDQIPVGAVSLSVTHAPSGGIRSLPLPGDAPLALSSAGLDLGDVVLDTEPPAVVASDPADTATGVPTDVVVEIEMSEPLARTADPGGLDASGVYLRRGAARIEAAVELDAADPTLVRVTPAAPLASESVYEVVMANGELRNALGEVIARGPRDLAGRPLRLPFVARFTTRDDDPPGLLSFTPAAGAEQVDPSAVLRLSFDEPLDPAGIAIELRDDQGALVPGGVAVGVGAQVVVFTPSAFLAPNRVYAATVSGVRDVAGNLAESQPFATSFATVDTLGPAIASFALAPGEVPVAGSTVHAVATLAAPEAGASLRVSLDFAPPVVSAPDVLAVPVALPNAVGTVVARAVAIDRFGNEGPLAELPIEVFANQPPVVSFARLEPASGPVPSGTRLYVEVSASDDAQVAELRASATGAATQPVTTSTGAPIVVDVLVPASAGAGSSVTLRGEAIDGSGASSGEQTLVVPVSDGVAPALAVDGPANGALVDPGSTFAVRVTASDAFGVAEVELAASGPVTGGGARTPGATSFDESFEIAVAPDAASNAPITLTATARDAAGNAAEPVVIALAVRDVVAPSVVSVAPADGALDVPPASAVLLTFSEPLDPATVGDASVRLEDEGGAPVAATLALSAGDTVATLTPQAPLAHAAAYTVRALASVADRAGNALGAEFTSRFTTAADLLGPRLTSLVPASGATDVSIAPLLRARFDEAVDRASFEAGALALRDLDGGDVPVEAALVFEDGDRDVVLVPAAPLGFDRAYALVLDTGALGADGNPVRGANGELLAAPLVHAFRTSLFGITAPRDGIAVAEGETLLLEAKASPALGVERVTFEVNGVAEAVAPAAPFQASLVVPSAEQTSALAIRAIGRNAAGDVVGDDVVTVSVQRALRIAPRILGVPVGGVRELRLVLSSPAPADLVVALAPAEGGVASVPESVVIAAGAREAVVPVTGLANGSTALVATSARGSAAAAVSVGTPVPGAAVEVFDQIGVPVEGVAPSELNHVIGAVVQQAPSAGQLLVPGAGVRSVSIPLLDAPAASALAVSIATSNAAVARVEAPATIAAGAQVAAIELVAGNDGVALLTLTAGGVSRVLTVLVGPPPDGVAAPLFEQAGAAVQRPALQVWLEPGASRTLALPLLPYPALFPASGSATSRDPALASVAPASFAFGVGESQTATLVITAGASPGVTVLDVRLGDLHRAIEVVVGTPSGVLIPDTRAPVTGVRVEP